MSNIHNEQLLEQLYDQAWEMLHPQIHIESELHEACIRQAQEWFEEMS
jgi:hypothetical protein